MISSEDEGPCYIDSETPAGWIKTLSEQNKNGLITASRKDLLNDCSIGSGSSDTETESRPEKRVVKKKKKKKVEEKSAPVNKGPQKVSANVKKVINLKFEYVFNFVVAMSVITNVESCHFFHPFDKSF